MSTLKVNAIRQTGASSDAVTLASDGTCTAKITNRSNRNLIINGAMQVAQRSTSTTDQGYCVADRFGLSNNNLDEATTNSQHALTSSDTGPWAAGFRNSFHIQNGNQTGGAGADDRVTLYYKTEAQDLANSGWDYTSASSYITLSFWVKSSVAQNFYFFFKTDDSTDYNYVMETGSLSANTWTKVTKTIPGNSNITINNDNGEGALLEFTLFRGTNKTGTRALNTWEVYESSVRVPDMTSTWYTTNDATWEITGVQLEVGDVATDFEHRSYGDELRRCQRYFNMHADGTATSTIGLAGSDGTYVFPVITFPVTMRAAPSLYLVTGSNYFTLKGPATAGFQVISANVTSIHTMEIVGTVSATSGQCFMIRTDNSAARLGFSAEL